MYLSRALASARQGNAIALGSTIPAPVKGWNARDPLDGMDPGFAISLDNWFPQTGYVELRKGSTAHATGIGSAAVESLFEHRSGTSHKLLAFGNSAVYDATASGAVGAALDSGFANNRWSSVNFTTYSVHVNGEDTPRTYDGSTFTTTTFTGSGLTATDLVHVAVFKNRLLFAANNSASFWYGPIFAVSGALNEFDLSAVYPAGGNLVAIGTITVDGGLGIDDLCAFIMESGAVLVYAGTDPGDATNWSLVGVFTIGAPVGRRCLMRSGTDLTVMTQDGFIPLLQFLRAGRGKKQLAISDSISGAVNTAVKAYGTNFGWQPVLYPKGSRAIFNVPLVEGSQAHQYVQNTITGAWCRFKNMNAQCWALYNDDLYFDGTDGKVYQADTGLADSGSNIEADGQTSYQYFGGRGLLKLFTMVRPVLGTDGALPVSLGLGVDFESSISVSPIADTTTAGATWDTTAWDTTPWAGAQTNEKGWQSAGRLGYSASIRLRTASKAQSIKWYATDVLFERGGFL